MQRAMGGKIVMTRNVNPPTFENEKCLRCNRLPVCMGVCPRDYMSGFSHCKYEVMDENFEVSLLDYLQHQLG